MSTQCCNVISNPTSHITCYSVSPYHLKIYYIHNLYKLNLYTIYLNVFFKIWKTCFNCRCSRCAGKAFNCSIHITLGKFILGAFAGAAKHGRYTFYYRNKVSTYILLNLCQRFVFSGQIVQFKKVNIYFVLHIPCIYTRINILFCSCDLHLCVNNKAKLNWILLFSLLMNVKPNNKNHSKVAILHIEVHYVFSGSR